jgi:hypothetical protein
VRNISVIVMALSAVLVILTGIGEAFPSHTGPASHHIAAASLFFAASCVHGWGNRKTVTKYFRGLGWRWAIIAGCFITVLVVGNLLA